MLDENNQKPNKNRSIYIIVGIAGLVAIMALAGIMSEGVDKRVVDAQDDVNSIQGQIDDLTTVIGLHDQILQQHDLQIGLQANNTNIIAGWAEVFSQNVDERLTTLEGEE